MRPPTNKSRPKASQWSKLEIKLIMERPASHPRTVIKDWNIPKDKATRNPCHSGKDFLAILELKATAKQSAERPKAIMRIE